MHKASSWLTMVSGIIGLTIAVLLGLLQWRIIWLQNQGVMFIDWNPYPQFLAMSLNLWIPISFLIFGASIYLTMHRKRSLVLKVGWGLQGVSCVGIISLAIWVFTVPLPGGFEMVWWLRWAG